MRCSLDGAPRNPDRNSNLAQELCGMAVIYDIYAPTVIYAPYPTSSRTARSAWSIATCA